VTGDFSMFATILTTFVCAAALAASAGEAHAQISGSIGGDVVARDPLLALSQPLTCGPLATFTGHSRLCDA
jgi:hypothetical protein